MSSLVCSSELSNLRGIMGSPEFAVGLVEVWVAQGQFCETKPLNLWSLTITLCRVRSELNCCTPSMVRELENCCGKMTHIWYQKKKTSQAPRPRVEQLFPLQRASPPSFLPTCIKCQSHGKKQMLAIADLALIFFFFHDGVKRGEKLAYPCGLVFFIYLFSYVFSALFYAPKEVSFLWMVSSCSLIRWHFIGFSHWGLRESREKCDQLFLILSALALVSLAGAVSLSLYGSSRQPLLQSSGSHWAPDTLLLLLSALMVVQASPAAHL